MFDKFDSIVFFVPNITVAAQWYADVLGCNIHYENSSYAYIKKNEFKIGFHPEDEKSASGKVGQTVYWSVISLSTARKFLENKSA